MMKLLLAISMLIQCIFAAEVTVKKDDSKLIDSLHVFGVVGTSDSENWTI